MIKCTTVGVEPSDMCYEICVMARRCGALKAWEREHKSRAERKERVMTRTEIWLTEMMCHFKSIDDMRRYYEHLVSLPNCNTCKRKNCEHKPKLGEDVRFNCFAYI